jgi:hypothetical protein
LPEITILLLEVIFISRVEKNKITEDMTLPKRK